MVYVFFADGFEEIEAVTVVDILRRTDINVKTVGVGKEEIIGAHNIKIICDITDDMVNHEDMEMIVLPGGMPGTLNLEKSIKVIEYIKYAFITKKYIAAICAAPSILGHLKLLEGKNVTCFDGFQDELGEDVIYTGKACEICDNIITANGPMAAMEFAETLAELLLNK